VNDFLKKIADFSPRRLALLAAELDERVRTIEQGLRAPIAIVGIGCRFPGGIRDAQTYWELLREGRDAITEVPQWRWDVNELYDPDPHAVGRVASRWGGFVDAPEFFDPAFFGIAPVEAESMDPQQRLLLEVAWEALEDAAIDPATLAGSRTGVYMGLCNSDYAHRALLHTGHGIDAWFAQGASHAVASGRISYFLGLRGPSISVDTACSSSLVAIHQACQSLRLNETELALAGGVNLLFSPEVTMALSRAQMMGHTLGEPPRYGNSIRATIGTLKGPLEISGGGLWPPNSAPALVATIAVPAALRQAFSPMLRMIAVERSEGSFELRLD